MESEEKKVILFETLCKRESKDGYFIMKGIRTKSDIEAGIGYSNIIGGDGVFGNLIGAKCTYAASYFKDSVQILTKCDVDKNKLNVNKSKILFYKGNTYGKSLYKYSQWTRIKK